MVYAVVELWLREQGLRRFDTFASLDCEEVAGVDVKRHVGETEDYGRGIKE